MLSFSFKNAIGEPSHYLPKYLAFICILIHAKEYGMFLILVSWIIGTCWIRQWIHSCYDLRLELALDICYLLCLVSRVSWTLAHNRKTEEDAKKLFTHHSSFTIHCLWEVIVSCYYLVKGTSSWIKSYASFTVIVNNCHSLFGDIVEPVWSPSHVDSCGKTPLPRGVCQVRAGLLQRVQVTHW